MESLESNRNLPLLLLTRYSPLCTAGVLLWRIPCNGRKFGNLTLRSGSARFLQEHFGVSPPDTILLTNEIVLPYNLVVASLLLPDLHPQLVQLPAQSSCCLCFLEFLLASSSLKLFILLGSQIRNAFMMVCPFIVLTIDPCTSFGTLVLFSGCKVTGIIVDYFYSFGDILLEIFIM